MLPALADDSVATGGSSNKEQLGQALFFDPILSMTRSQSCATCHAPDKGFSDHRGEGVAAAVSLGDDGKSLGDRNAPAIGYAAFIPPFHRNDDGVYVGGQFWDGRASTLVDQAEGPPLNPIEMALPDKQTLVTRLAEHPSYQPLFAEVYGSDIFHNADATYRAVADAIASFEQTALFAPFDSKYDRYLRGEVSLTPEEDLGMTLFFSQQFTNCNLCHQLQALPGSEQETFSNYEFHNIGVPENTDLRALNAVTMPDEGLFAHPDVSDPLQRGKFKTPTLRNVAVTAPYMHNGVFKDLRTVVLFYNKYNSRKASMQINPETGEPWREAEIAENLSLDELETGPALDDRRVDALVAFLKTLTDQRYEHLLASPQGLEPRSDP
ncbi:cytochrome-c peroxidase [Nitrincola sp.]|uniref:cytochrome-c peroxidase n=1 Tax=Nitrincola sp. TaxID=1926584 RepID=UPI003A8DF7B3